MKLRTILIRISWLFLVAIFAGCGAPAPDPIGTPAGAATGELIVPLPTSTQGIPDTGTSASATAPAQENTAIPTQGAPEGWVVLAEPASGYQLAYPAEWELCTQTEHSRVFCGAEDTGGPSFPVFYITVIPSGFENADASAYNFLREEALQELMNLEVGSSVATEAIPEYYTFSRLPDLTIGGENFVQIENSRVWEAPAGVKDRRALLAVDGKIFMLGTYYETAEELERFQTVLENFALTQ